MALVPGLPTPLPKWATFLIRLGEAGAYLLLESLVDDTSHADDREALEWRRLVVEFTRGTPATTIEDKAHCTFDLINITSGQVDTSWTSGDFTTCETFFDEWLTAWKMGLGGAYTVTRYKWYRMRFREVMTVTHRFEETGPPVRSQAKTIVGTSSANPLPYQVAMSVTEKTGVPKHWGRFYLPGITENMLTSDYGRWSTSWTSTVANASAELYDDLAGAEFFPVVPVTQVNKVLTGGLLGVSSIQVDDIPDVIRRRRPRQPVVRTIGVPTA